MSKQLSNNEQDEIVVQLTTNLGGMIEDDEFEALFEQLDVDHRLEVNDAIREFANNAVGSDHWESDN